MILNQRISPSLSEKQPYQQARVCLQSGFTLIELMVVLAVLGALIVVAVPKLKEMSAHSSVNNATSALFVTLKRARTLAVAESRSIKVTLVTSDPYSFIYDAGGCANCKAKTILLKQFSPNLTLKDDLSSEVIFKSRGTTDNRIIKIKNGDYFKCIKINDIGRAYIVQLGATADVKTTCDDL